MVARLTLSAIVAALAVVFASGVQAATPSDSHDRQGLAVTLQDSHDRIAVQPASMASTTGAGIQDAQDRGSISRQPIVVASGGFDWGDATIGALAGMGFALLLGGVVFLALAQRTRARLAVR